MASPGPARSTTAPSPAVRVSRQRLLAAALAVFALALTAAAFGSLAESVRLASHGYFWLASLLFLAAAFQSYFAARQFRTRASRPLSAPARFATDRRPLVLVSMNWLRWIFSGAVGCYLAALALGPQPGVSATFLALAILWSGLLLLPLAAHPQVLDRWRKLVESRTPRRAGAAIYYASLVWVLIEGSLGAYQASTLWAPAPRLAVAPRQLAQISTAAYGGSMSGDPRRPGRLRVAVIGAGSERFAPPSGDWLAQLESHLPGMQICHMATQRRGPLCEQQLDARQPTDDQGQRPVDLVLAFVTVGNDLPRRVESAELFDWRRLPTVWALGHLWGSAEPRPATAPSAVDYETFADAGLSRLAVCRTPIDESMRRHWQASYRELDALVATCRATQTAAAIVVVPADFQVNRVLCNTLRRRAGCEEKQLDLTLPQRRWQAYAHERGLLLLDLLPYLRATDETVYRHNDQHWNEQGSRLTALALSGWLESQYGSTLAAAQLSSRP